MRKSIVLTFTILLISTLSLPLFAKKTVTKGNYIITALNEKQEGTVKKILKKPFIIRVTDKKGTPIKGMRVEAILINADKKSTLLYDEATRKQKKLKKKTLIFDGKYFTDKNGEAKIRFRNGNSIKQYKIIAKVFEKNKITPIHTFKLTSMAIDIINIIFYVMGGLGLFLFGMKLLSDGLQGAAGNKMKSILGFLTKNKYMGVFVGFLVTAALQSSSVTTVMLVGFVNAGLIEFAQTIGIVMGANIGTTITGFIISLKVGAYALPIIGIGFTIFFMSKTKNLRFWGEVLLGFGILFLGLSTMGIMLKPLKASPTLSLFFVQFARYPILAVMAGMVITFLIQSSSATLGLIITLGITGLIDIQGAFALVLASIG